MILNLYLWFLFYSFFGWVYESMICSIASGKLINRGFLTGPVCPIYGVGALLLIGVLSPIRSPVLLFFAGMLLTCSLEYFTSWLLEKLFHARWWDYSHYRVHLNGRVCLLGALVFGIFSVVLLFLLHPLVVRATAALPYDLKLFFAGFFLSSLAIDGLVTLKNLMQLTQKLNEIQSAINTFLEESRSFLEESRAQAETLLATFAERFEGSRFYNERIRSLLSNLTLQDRRILRAFPTLKSKWYGEALQNVKQRLKLTGRRNGPKE